MFRRGKKGRFFRVASHFSASSSWIITIFLRLFSNLFPYSKKIFSRKYAILFVPLCTIFDDITIYIQNKSPVCLCFPIIIVEFLYCNLLPITIISCVIVSLKLSPKYSLWDIFWNIYNICTSTEKNRSLNCNLN